MTAPSAMVTIVPTGVANLASVVAAARRLGVTPVFAESPREIEVASAVLLPGVGSFGHAMEELRRTGAAPALTRRIRDGRPTMGICLGMQILAEGSEESPGVRGLGILPGLVTRLRIHDATTGRPLRVPQMGWNGVRAHDSGPNEGMIEAGNAYFANSFASSALSAIEAVGWRVARSEHGTTFAAAVERGPLLFTQFHPELSGPWGLALMSRWLRKSGVRARDPAVGPITRSLQRLGSRVIPCLDVRDGRVVKGVKFQGLRDAGDPAERAAAYEAQGADELVVLDVSATDEGRRAAARTVEAVRAVLSIPLTVGGGVRSPDDAKRLLDAGADKISVNTAAVANPNLLSDLAEQFGRQCVVLALDAARREPAAAPPAWEVVTHAGKTRTGIDACVWAREAQERGAGEILLTSWDRDGTGHGYDTDLLSAVSGAVQVPVIASGGASSPTHLTEALRAGADAVLAATIFHDGVFTIGEVKRELSERGLEVRA